MFRAAFSPPLAYSGSQPGLHGDVARQNSARGLRLDLAPERAQAGRDVTGLVVEHVTYADGDADGDGDEDDI